MGSRVLPSPDELLSGWALYSRKSNNNGELYRIFLKSGVGGTFWKSGVKRRLWQVCNEAEKSGPLGCT
jgi:hypothetical protein